MADNKFNTAGVSSTSTQIELTVKDLMPNNYLTIVWKDTTTGKIASTLDINNEKASEYTVNLNNAIDQAINSQKINYFGQNKYIDIQSIAKYIAQNTIEAGVQRSIVNALIGVATGNAKKTPDAIVNLCLNGFGTIADKTARALGWTDPHNIFSQVAGENVIGVFRELGNKTRDFLEDKIKDITKTKRTSVSTTDKQTGKQYVGLILGLTTSDQESYEVTIPRKKVENGSDYTTHLLPQPFKKDFTVNLTNRILTGSFDRTSEIDNIEKVKDKLIEIANSHTLFDIYIRLSPEKMYKRSNVSFSSLSFTKDENSGNGYTATFTIEPVNEFKTKIFISNKKYGTGTSKGKGSTGGQKTNRKQKDKNTDGKSFKIGFADYELKDTTVFKNLNQAKQYGAEQGLDIYYSETHNPKYMFVKDVSHVEGGYALTVDTWRNPASGVRDIKGGIGYRYTKEKIGDKLYINTGKEKYTIIKCNYGSISSSNIAWDKYGNIIRQ